MSFTLRPATPDDADFVDHLEGVCMRDYAEALWGDWVPSIRKYGFEPTRHRIVMIEGREAGCIDVWEKDGYLELNKLYLLPEARRHGIGARLLSQVRAEAWERGLPFRLTVLTSNPLARKFYEREGLRIATENRERWVMEPAA